MSWKTGQSERFRQAVDPHLDEVIDAVIQAALAGATGEPPRSPKRTRH